MTRPAPRWDPDRYLAHADERGRPFVELVARVGAEAPGTVVDLGCGPGNLTGLLAQRWPDAEVVGVDSSEEMVAAARALPGLEVRYEVGDVRDWSLSEAPVDVLVCNAVLQWVPGHLDLLPRLLEAAAPGGWLALQVPGNMGEPSHVLRRQLAAAPPYSQHTRGIAEPASQTPETYLRALQAAGCRAVDAWETTYLHVLHGEDPVLSWISGTSLRPTLAALPEGLRERFTGELAERLREAYPDDGRGVVLPFRRVFVVARP